ncbi:MAG TPA: acyltransferase family protein [Ilumatobacter sp.]|nr:acyltransferase family protein [Ilumatobacter sp.]
MDTTVTTARPWRPAQHLSSVPYLPGLDGMRALAVVAVMVYHANSDWLYGGFLGVEVFFVISGYLITLLLMAEHERTGRVDLVGFWIRRARRLLPALFVMLFLLLTYTAFFKASTLGQLRGDLLAGLGYSMNWYQIWVGQGYSASGDFAPLRHLWSLAVEEQFYLLWPIVMMFLLRSGTRKLAKTALVLFVAAVVVNVVMALLYHGGPVGTCELTPEAYWNVGDRCISKADTLYLSTITRSGGLLLGAAFAMFWRPVAILRGPLRNAGRSLDIAAMFGVAILGLLFWKVNFLTPEGADPWLFRGGFFVTGFATLMVIGAVTHRYAFAGKVLGNRLFAYVGTRSYGLYLYHWPIYQIIREVAGNKLTLPQFAVAMVATLVITELSYTYIETPIRKREVAIWWANLRRRRDPVPRQLVAFTLAGSMALLAFGVIRMGTADLQQNEIARSLEEGSEFTTDIEDLLNGGASGTTVPSTSVAATDPLTNGSTSPQDSTTTTEATTTTTTIPLPSEPVRVLAIGDSVMKGAADVLVPRGWTVVAEESLQMAAAVPMVEELKAAGVLEGTQAVIVHLGTNGTISEETLNALLAPLSQVPNVLIYTIKANRSWTAGNNAILRERDRPGDNIALIDWELRSQECTDRCFAGDGIHLNATGKTFYADLAKDWTGV